MLPGRLEPFWLKGYAVRRSPHHPGKGSWQKKPDGFGVMGGHPSRSLTSKVGQTRQKQGQK